MWQRRAFPYRPPAAGIASFALVVALPAGDAIAWNAEEHKALCKHAYLEACSKLHDVLAGEGESTPGTSSKPSKVFEFFCGSDERENRAEQYGEACALAGDRLVAPGDFTNSAAGRPAIGTVHHAVLAISNHRHFNPEAPRAWREYHQRAIRLAQKASEEKKYLAAIDAVWAALYESAFANHFVHDAFSSGHIGFNRPASSLAASLSYHDRWAAKGRMVRNAAGECWYQKGDNHLCQNEEGCTRMRDATNASLYGVLHTAITGKRDDRYDEAVASSFAVEYWREPDADDTLWDFRDKDGYWTTTLSVSKPAYIDAAFGASYVTLTNQDGDVSHGFSLGPSAQVTWPWGSNDQFRKLMSPYVDFTAGAVSNSQNTELNFMVAPAFSWGLGFTNDGLLSHAVALQGMFVHGEGNFLHERVLVGGGYGGWLEIAKYRLGLRVLVGLDSEARLSQAGTEERQNGFVAMVSFSPVDYVLRARGGSSYRGPRQVPPDSEDEEVRACVGQAHIEKCERTCKKAEKPDADCDAACLERSVWKCEAACRMREALDSRRDGSKCAQHAPPYGETRKYCVDTP